MENILGTYFLGATIVNQAVLRRVQYYVNKIFICAGNDARVLKEVHITLIPPFKASYVAASELNIACMCSTLLSKHPLVSTPFIIQGMKKMSWGDMEIIHFPIHVSRRSGECFHEYIKVLRDRVTGMDDFRWKEAIPDDFYPHITATSVPRHLLSRKIDRVVVESEEETALCFKSGYPTLYAKYKEDGWQTISDNPEKGN